jgi:hypothetical protein
MKQISQETRAKRISKLIASTKFLSNPKYYKTNKVSCAAWDSWAAQGKVGGCSICNTNHYNFNIHNTRHNHAPFIIFSTTKKHWPSVNIGGKLCSNCYNEVEKQCNYVFKKY